MRDTVRQAVAMGFEEICFLDHLILDGPGTKNSMHRDEVPLYMQAVSVLRREFRDRISIRVGLEVDFNPERLSEILAITESFDFDMIGGSVHFVRGYNVASSKVPLPKGPDNERDMALAYFEQVRAMVEHDFFDVLCHPDVVKKSGMVIHPDCTTLIDEILDTVAAKQLTLEFNTGGWDHPGQESYPSENIARKCHEKNIAFTLGSDAHRPGHVGKNFGKALDILKQIGFTHLNVFKGRTARSVPLWG